MEHLAIMDTAITMDVVANRKEAIMYPFNNFNRNFRRVDRAGIPVIPTTYTATSTANDQVTYGICPIIWRQLPNEGIFLMNVEHTPVSTTEPTAVVSVDPTRSSVSNNTSVNSSTGKQLLNGSGEQMVNSEVSTGNKYLVYYNKCCGTFQVMNHIVPAATPAA